MLNAAFYQLSRMVHGTLSAFHPKSWPRDPGNTACFRPPGLGAAQRVQEQESRHCRAHSVLEHTLAERRACYPVRLGQLMDSSAGRGSARTSGGDRPPLEATLVLNVGTSWRFGDDFGGCDSVRAIPDNLEES